MKPSLKIGLALVVVFVFLLASKLLASEAASARAALQSTPRITASQAGVQGTARIKPPLLPPVSASVEAGKTEVKFPPGGSASAHFPNASLSLLGTQLLGTGVGSGGVSITQTGPESFHLEGRSITNKINLLDGAVTADRCETRLTCDLVSGNLTCPVQSAVFKDLKVNGASMPNQPQPNTEVVFRRQVMVGGIHVDVEVVVVLGPTSVKRRGNRTMVRQGGVELTTRGRQQVKNNLKNGIAVAPDQMSTRQYPITSNPISINPAIHRVTFLPFNQFRNSSGISYGELTSEMPKVANGQEIQNIIEDILRALVNDSLVSLEDPQPVELEGK